MVMISLSTSPGCGPRFLAGWASSLSSRASQCGRNAWQKSSNWQKSSTSRSNIDASPHLMAPTQKEEFKGDKGLASPQTRNSGYHKQQPTFADTLAAIRREIWKAQGLSISRTIPDVQKLPQRLRDGITHALCYAA